MTYARLRGPSTPRVIWDGQSYNNLPAPPNDIPANVMAGLGVPYRNVAIDATGWGTLSGTASTRLFPWVRLGAPDILVMNGGQADVVELEVSEDADDLWAAITGYADAARAAGFDRILYITIAAMGPNILGFGIPTAAQTVARLDVNARAVADTSGRFDAVADIAASLTDATNGTYYMADRLHLKTAGGVVATGIIRPQLISLLASL